MWQDLPIGFAQTVGKLCGGESSSTQSLRAQANVFADRKFAVDITSGPLKNNKISPTLVRPYLGAGARY